MICTCAGAEALKIELSGRHCAATSPSCSLQTPSELVIYSQLARCGLGPLRTCKLHPCICSFEISVRGQPGLLESRAAPPLPAQLVTRGSTASIFEPRGVSSKCLIQDGTSSSLEELDMAPIVGDAVFATVSFRTLPTSMPCRF